MNDSNQGTFIMGIPQTPNPSPSHLYPHEIQLKLYQAFIFSIPILFTIILVLLFYLFYLKRRASSLSSSPFHILPRRSNPQTTYHYSSSVYRLDYLTVQFLDKLPRVLFDDDLRARDSLCCVCLGEFELKEELLQIPHCKHMFHIECIHNWLKANITCPLCRCSIIPTTTTKFLSPTDSAQQGGVISGSPSHIILLPPQLEDEASASSNNTHILGE
ncbi:PREDICTED: probable E3 ubiquitin-protein ligase RHA4A isoform X2 [Lupinus angustifolius]|uniref:probable E3 ubiquitin-protein ligase RHA4A isoform X2 n=1 Tax=Lupinus angustifolius TaxID=3871 RepID=UPI00092FA750|nr:PREDICTED: probable E3 ubiquitin-protein ligase RHA4A isoform X2 [Lupinus angustifolius]